MEERKEERGKDKGEGKHGKLLGSKKAGLRGCVEQCKGLKAKHTTQDKTHLQR